MKDYVPVMKIVHRLRLAKGAKAKLAVLDEFEFHEPWRKCLKAMYDSSINYYNAAPVDNTFIEDCDLEGMFDVLVSFKEGLLKGNEGKRLAHAASQEYGEMFRLILGGSLKAGISVTTINKAYPSLIPTFKVMLAQDTKVDCYPVLASIKYDGVRLVVRVQEKVVTAYTRSGKVVEIKSLKTAMGKLPDGYYDGELVRGHGTMAGRSGITGDVNRCLKGTSTDIPNYTYCIFDVVPINDWLNQETHLPYSARYTHLMNVVSPYKVSYPQVKIVEQHTLHDAFEVNRNYENLLELGYEGVILRYPKDVYEWKRGPKLIKKKAVKEAVLRCVGVVEGKGKYKSMIGALECEGIVENRSVTVTVGSGLSDHDRELSPEHYLEQDIEILYNSVVNSKLGESKLVHSLFLPRFKRLGAHRDI